MKRNPVFTFDGGIVAPLEDNDEARLQSLHASCEDFMLLSNGTPSGPDSAREELRERNDTNGVYRTHLLGVFDGEGALVGELGLRDDYPLIGDRYLGLLLLAPQVRGTGLGQRVVEAWLAWIRTQGATRALLGVLEENKRALRFWSRMGFRTFRRVGPRQFGEKWHMIFEMQRWLVAPPKEDPLARFLDDEGRLTQMPLDDAVRLRALAFLAQRFDEARDYSEAEVNDVLRANHTFNDWAWLRRELYDRRFLERTPDGRVYRLRKAA